MSIRRWICTVLSIYYLSLRACDGLTSVELFFTSQNCDEESRRLDENKYYNLTWRGQNTPKLCSFSFTGGISGNSRSYQVCFESIVYDLPYSMGNVEIKITNFTRSAWQFDRHDGYIGKTCVKSAYKLNISIVLPKGYSQPSESLYLKLKITAEKYEDSISILSYIFMGVFGVIFVACACGMFGCFRSARAGNHPFKSCCELLGSCVDRIGKCGCDCDCDCREICRPLGECCTAWASTCAACIGRLGHGSNNEPPATTRPEQTEINNIQEESDHFNGATSSDSPPSYYSIQDTKGPTAPPPRYEDVAGFKYPSAPPLAKIDY